jgi:hypothetical protein
MCAGTHVQSSNEPTRGITMSAAPPRDRSPGRKYHGTKIRLVGPSQAKTNERNQGNHGELSDASVHIHTDNFGPPILHSMRLGRRSLNFAHVPVVYPGHLPIVPGDRDCIPTCFGDNAAISGIASPVDAGTLLEILRFADGHCCSTGCLGSHT